ncbi:MAG: nucleotide exchange factor GrpE [Deltaproteobacteria bacterium]|nr:nucleotide exchange factor GrpE [Deltaproteobacteria bacterium]
MSKTQSSHKKAEKPSPETDAPQTPADEQSIENEVISDPVKELENRCETAEQESRQHYERLLRVSADFENFKKRSFREADDFRKYANELLLLELLTVVDNLERAIQATSSEKKTVGCVIEGVEMTLKALLKIFEKFSVKPIEAVGKPFDPNFHQAMMQEASDAHPENTIISEFQKGYLLHDRLLRPSMVVVSKGPEKAE